MALLTDGYQTTVQIAAFPAIFFREREVQPPDLDALGEIDISTMRNTRLRTKNPKSLVTVGPMVMQVQWDPSDYQAGAGQAALGVNTQVIITFPDGSQLTFQGWLDKFKPASMKEGEFPMAEITIIPSNQINSVENAPVWAAAPGVGRSPPLE